MIRLVNIKKQYGDHLILNNINLSIKANDFLVIKGKSGSGKTSLLNILGLIDYQYEGQLYFKGSLVEGVRQCQTLRKQYFAFVFQDFKLIHQYTIRENLLLILSLHPKIKERGLRIESCLKAVNLDQSVLSRFPYQLSGGEQQRLAIARALLSGAEILICDEITGALDRENSLMIVDLLKQLQLQGKTIIFVTHDESFFEIGSHLYDLETGILSCA